MFYCCIVYTTLNQILCYVMLCYVDMSGEIKPSPVGPLHSRVIFAKLFVKSGNSLCDYKHHSENHLVCVVNISCVLDTRRFYSFSNVFNYEIYCVSYFDFIVG